jgi:hypothetical protein
MGKEKVHVSLVVIGHVDAGEYMACRVKASAALGCLQVWDCRLDSEFDDRCRKQCKSVTCMVSTLIYRHIPKPRLIRLVCNLNAHLL